jgi:ribosomal protein S18 acetylase RimI-like enzyme
MDQLYIKEVKSKSELNRFISFPEKLYKANKYRVPQLHSIERSTLSPKKNPAFDYCEAKLWMAYIDNVVVGRIAAIINTSANKVWNEKVVRFGWIEFIDDKNVSEILIKKVEDWGKTKGMELVQGPLGFTDFDLEGMLVEGFEEMGTQAVIYNYPYYPVHLEKHGYKKDVDWVQFEIKIPDKVPDKIKRVAAIVQKKYKVRPLKFKKAKDILPYAGKMFHLLNDSFKNLYGFVPLTEKQIKYYTKMYFTVINPRFVCFIVDENDEMIGFGLSVVSLSKALIKAKGKLFPFGFIHILKALKYNDTVDILLQAVKPEYINKGIPSIFFKEMIEAYIDAGIKTAISSHALENNKSAFLMFDDFDSRKHLKRRSYTKQI